MVKNKISITLNEKLLKEVDSVIDNLFIRNRSQAIEYLMKEALKENKVAVILAAENNAGAPNRINNRYSIKINNLTILERTIRKLRDSGFKAIYIVADRPTLTNIFKIIGDGSDLNVKIEFITEENPQGNIAALKLLKGKIRKPFLVMHCDILIDNLNLTNLWQRHFQEKSVATLLVNSPHISQGSEHYKKVNVKLQGNKVVSYVLGGGKPETSIFSVGVYVAEPDLLSLIGNDLDKDIFPELAKKGLLGGYIDSTEVFHIHTPQDITDARKKLLS